MPFRSVLSVLLSIIVNFSEQHEQYVQFVREQMDRQDEGNNVEISYLS